MYSGEWILHTLWAALEEMCWIHVLNKWSAVLPARSHTFYHEGCKVISTVLNSYLKRGLILIVFGIDICFILHQAVCYSCMSFGCSQVQGSIPVRQGERGIGTSVKELAHKECHLCRDEINVCSPHPYSHCMAWSCAQYHHWCFCGMLWVGDDEVYNGYYRDVQIYTLIITADVYTSCIHLHQV